MNPKQAEYVSEMTKSKMESFQKSQNVFSKGKLSFVIQFTLLMKGRDFPLHTGDFSTANQGQVKGIGGGNLKKVLQRHGITKRLTSEGGRTSRGNMGLMSDYVDFLNQWSRDEQTVPLDEIENYWATEIRKFFDNQPFVLSADASKTVRATLDELFEQAKSREQQNKGTRYLGTMIQHLVAAKLQVILPEATFSVYGASVADSPTDRAGDFVINKTIIHCTTMPNDLLMEKCKKNLNVGGRPVIITIYDRVHTAMNMIEDAGLTKRVEVWDIQQFLSSNVLEHSLFQESNRNATLDNIVRRYNQIIDQTETDPSLRIKFNSK